MPPSNILVIVVDGLRASALGAYGNTTYSTPALDRLAAKSLTFDACYAPAIELEAIYRALWQSRFSHADAADAQVQGVTKVTRSLPAVLKSGGFRTLLVTDAPELASFTGYEDFDECVRVHSADADVVRATDAAATGLAKVLATACDVIAAISDARGDTTTSDNGQQCLLWVHARSMNGPWDAPRKFQAEMLAEGDPPPVETTAVPNLQISHDSDPDLAFRYGTAYASQVVVLDECWDNLSEFLSATTQNRPWLIMLIGARGFSLGEHQRIGSSDCRLPVEQLHVPWLMQFPDGHCQLARSSALVSHYDLMPTLLEWSGIGNELFAVGSSVLSRCNPTSPNGRDAMLSTGSKGFFAIRTAEWCLRGTIEGIPGMNDDAKRSLPVNDQLELFVRPDDRWEANDVAKLCPEVAEELREDAVRRLQQAARGEAFL